MLSDSSLKNQGLRLELPFHRIFFRSKDATAIIDIITSDVS